ncbi:MAG: CPBP family intramembrane glutamic endopeptidase [Gemmatimonadota bacterium]|nr:CPBP family intramembrane glutamic endopeptidase [Gemmatimonadota bacterium]
MTSDTYPSLTRAVGLLLVTLLVAAALAAVTYEALPGWPDILRMALPTEIALALAVVWAVGRSDLGWRRALAWRGIEARHLMPLFLILVGSLTVFSELYVVIQKVVPVPASFERALAELLELSGPVDAIATIGVAVVLAPLLEEALFRGAILQGFARRYGPRRAALWTAVFFAFFHLYNPWQIIPTFFLGVVLAWLVLTTRSLWSAIVVHSAFNAASLALFTVELDPGPGAGDAVPWLVAGIVVALLAGSLALLGGMVWLERQTGGGWFEDVSADGGPDGDEWVDYETSSGSGPSTARR